MALIETSLTQDKWSHKNSWIYTRGARKKQKRKIREDCTGPTDKIRAATFLDMSSNYFLMIPRKNNLCCCLARETGGM